jgi:hypothetical protein
VRRRRGAAGETRDQRGVEASFGHDAFDEGAGTRCFSAGSSGG